MQMIDNDGKNYTSGTDITFTKTTTTLAQYLHVGWAAVWWWQVAALHDLS